MDTFKIKGSDVGNVQKVVIRHDNSGMGSDWHLEMVRASAAGSLLRRGSIPIALLVTDVSVTRCTRRRRPVMCGVNTVAVAATPCPQVEVTNPNTSKTYFFPCNDWLRKVGDDESGLKKELVAGSPDQKGPTNYKVRTW